MNEPFGREISVAPEVLQRWSLTEALARQTADELAAKLDSLIRQALVNYLGADEIDLNALNGRLEKVMQGGQPDRYCLDGFVMLEVSPIEPVESVRPWAVGSIADAYGFKYRFVPPGAMKWRPETF